MKRLLLVLTFFFSVHSYANCYEFELIGEGRIEEDQIIFLVAKETISEVKLSVPFEEQNHFTPYIERLARASLILDRPQVDFNTKIKKVIGVEYQTPDPLNTTAKKTINQIRKVECPKN